MEEITFQMKKGKEAAIKLATLNEQQKNDALLSIAKALDEQRAEIIKANHLDIERSTQEGIDEPLLKRLKFDDKKIDGVIDGINSLIKLEDPVGKILAVTELDESLNLYKESCPIGLIGIIFESRPDALVQISSLCLKSGNAVVLKGGSEAKETNKILANIIQNASTKESDVPTEWITLIETREDVGRILGLDEYIDLIIPRGSNAFVRYIMENSRIPVLGHADGICHCYVDEFADIDKAVDIVIDSKTQYVSVCNALETLLVHESIAKEFLPLIKGKLEAKNVEIKGCERTIKIIDVQSASDEDWATEYLDYVLSIKIVDSLDEAINHINQYGSGHTDVIVTEDKQNVATFFAFVDSGNVFFNCSSRFSDGFRYGFGAEVGISTNKIHARGPVGLEGLMSYKYKLYGDGHIVAPYAEGEKTFTHKKIK